MYKIKTKLTKNLHVLLGIVATLIVIGMLFIYSSSSIFALENYGTGHHFIKKQLFGLLIGLITFCAARYIRLELLFSKISFFFWSSWILTVLTLVPKLGVRIYGSSRWLKLGPLTFQPS